MTFDKDLLFNGSKVKDPTACKAIMEAEKMKYMRGEIYEAESKAGGNMYVLVVSADFRGGDEMLSIIKLLTDQKGPDDVAISCHGIRYASPRAVQYIFRPSILTEKVYYNRDTFYEDIEEALYYRPGKMSEAEFLKKFKEEKDKYDPYWVNCIFIYVDN